MMISLKQTQFCVRNNPFKRFPTRKMYSISLKALKEQFSKTEDAGNIEVPEFSLSTSVYFYDNVKIICCDI